jgi:hypothetical protein
MTGKTFFDYLDYAPRIVGVILVVTIGVYLAGFVIVNAYLSQFNVSQLEIVHPSYLSAGILFLLISFPVVLLTAPIAALMSYLLGYANSLPRGTLHKNVEKQLSGIDQQIENIKGKKPRRNLREHFKKLRLSVTKWGLILPTKKGYRCMVVLVAILLGFVAPIVGFVMNIPLRLMLDWASRGLIASLSTSSSQYAKDIEHLQVITCIQSIVGVAAFLLIFLRRKLSIITQAFCFALVGAMFIAGEAYSTMLVADRLYGHLPQSIGGGHVENVIFFVNCTDSPMLWDMNLISEESFDICSSDQHRIITTYPLDLFWQLEPGGSVSSERM